MKSFYVIGNPVNQSLSPKVFTYIFNKLNIKAKYSMYMPQNMNDLTLFFKNEIDNFAGLNITLPYKINTFGLMHKCDNFSSRIKAVNCVKNIDGMLMGYNTDYYGFSKMLDNINIDKFSILILGNGGVARTVAYALKEHAKNNIYVWGRNNNKVSLFIQNFNSINIKPYAKSLNKPCIVINCLPFMIDEDSIHMIINKIFPKQTELFIDLNYTETLFSKKLIEKKYNVILGLDMFIFQALKSFDIWFDNQYQNKITYEEIKKLLSK